MLFSDIIGQEEVKKRLVNTVKENRVSHAQLFLGPEGSGNLAMALAYAQYLSCTARTDSDSCNNCPSCFKHNKLVHPDLHMAYPVTLSKDVRISANVAAEWREAVLQNPYLNLNDWFSSLDAENKQPVIGVEESADILKRLSLTTYEAEYKIMLIWMVEKMNQQAANKLLKILEEPPEKTLFLLVCENDEQLLKTIVSRTQLVKMKKLNDQVLAHALQQKNSVPADHALKVAHLSDGNYNTALKLLGENDPEASLMQPFRNWMLNCLNFNPAPIISWSDEMSKAGREAQKIFLSYALHIARECMMMNYADPSLVRLQGEEYDFVKKFARFIHSGNCDRFSEEISKARNHIERNANPKILFLDLSFKMNELLNIKEAVSQ
jgi:DNA polymerase III subunit delta'